MLLVAAYAPTFAQPAPASRFDGDWVGNIDCPSNTEESGARGYRYRFPAMVKDGVFAASIGSENSPGSLHIEGPIRPDGSAELRARGRTGNLEYALEQPSSGTPNSYRVKAQFDGDKGTGSRIEARACNFVFAKK